MYYSAVGILAFLVLLTENKDILLKRNRISKAPAGQAYRQFLFAVLVYYFTDIVWGWFEAEKWAALLFADTAVYFIAMAAGVLCWTRTAVIYLGEKDGFSRFILYAGRVFAGTMAVLSVINCFTPVLFIVDEGCVYTALDIRYVILIVQIVLLLLVSAYAFRMFFRLQDTRKAGRFRTVGLFGLIKSLFLIVQLWYPYLPLYTVAYMLGTCLLHTFVISDEEREIRGMLAQVEKKQNLQQSVSALLDNMPALSFYKDAETGAYIACNQAFAEYAHKETPAGVIGLTDAEIFDEVTARHFMEDDKMALAMDRPYIFFEDVPDAAGNQRQFQTTKLKFVDPSGKLCLLGMCQDVTSREQIRRAEERMLEERTAYTRISALAGDYIAIFIVNPESGRYREYSTSFRSISDAPMREGSDFFSDLRSIASELVYPEDLEHYLHVITAENILTEIGRRGIFSLMHRIVAADGQPRYVQFRAAVVQEKEGRRLIAGINDIDMQVRQEEEYRRRLSRAQAQAAVDALTGVRNKHAYLEAEEKINRLIAEKLQPPFAVSVLDVNDLKKVNDTAGHQAGDECLREACRIVCRAFKHSPVFRIGGDEFVAISSGEDYDRIEELTALIAVHNEEALRSGGVVIACGMSRFADDESVATVFERADRVMYENKNKLKALAQEQ